MLKINKVQMVAKDHQIYSFLISKCITSMGLLQVSDEQEMWILQCMLILQIALSFCQENSAHLFASGEGLVWRCKQQTWLVASVNLQIIFINLTNQIIFYLFISRTSQSKIHLALHMCQVLFFSLDHIFIH